MQQNIRSNFEMLKAYGPQLCGSRQGLFKEDSNTSLPMQKKLVTLLVQNLAALVGRITGSSHMLAETLGPREIKPLMIAHPSCAALRY